LDFRQRPEGTLERLLPNPTQQDHELDLDQLFRAIGARTFTDAATTRSTVQEIRNELEPLLTQARQAEANARDGFLQQMTGVIRQRFPQAQTDAGRRTLQTAIETIESFQGSRGSFGQGVATWANQLVRLLNEQPRQNQPNYLPSLTVVIGENEDTIAGFARQVVQNSFDDRRTRSLLYPAVSFIFCTFRDYLTVGSDRRILDGSRVSTQEVIRGAVLR
jgi:hypothetical protein